MNLKESILTLSRYQKKLDEEYAGLKAELEKIMFEYHRISIKGYRYQNLIDIIFIPVFK